MIGAVNMGLAWRFLRMTAVPDPPANENYNELADESGGGKLALLQNMPTLLQISSYLSLFFPSQYGALLILIFL